MSECPRCGKLVPARELIEYGSCEDCWALHQPSNFDDVKRHQLGGNNPYPGDRGYGGTGQDEKRGKTSS